MVLTKIAELDLNESVPDQVAKSSIRSIIIIGKDFGTTFSGVAYTWSTKGDKVQVITSWDTDNYSSSNEEKTPSALSFLGEGQVNWGYSVPKDADQLKWFKLLLLDEEDLPEDVKASSRILEARAYLRSHNRTPIEAIAVYLRCLWNHCIQRITESVSKTLVNYSKFHVVMTLPAIWPDYARSRMREAANIAGILGPRAAGETELTFLSEPEAAAIATFADMEGRQVRNAGDTFVVVDCGGGTADVISYSVTQSDPMVVRESVRGEGGLCGAVFVDEAFVNMLKDKMQPKKWDMLSAETRQRLIHDEWEHGIKQRFDTKSNKTWSFNLPWECLAPEERLTVTSLPKVTFTSKEIQGAFNPVIYKINRLIHRQALAVMKKHNVYPKYVILVGGFGRCKYLFERVKTMKNHLLSEDIEVLQARGADPWTAICRGAVFHASASTGIGGSSIKIGARISRASYGTSYFTDWDPLKHQEGDKFWSDIEQRWCAKRQMDWFLLEGEDISTKKPIKKQFFRIFSPDEKCTALRETIYLTTISPPPDRVESTVKLLCSINWDMVVDILSLPTRTNSLGNVYHVMSFEIEMTCSGSSIDFAVIYNGKRQGSKNVAVEYSTR
ncbi:hypothetical protein SMACR_07358 [Sordaria macrospora]|uniref:Uncharacterized protein n=1 Tax=Sordaria macrospora TaxID=5147 RepID=A0A8S8ZS93_SORMA|nr:hypothetical protein SMACR_07358 [Sordaria macrospora]WPJ61700.1 hypothetical protein SMAC4_07358 [Sordaria macrospora]